MSIKTDKQSMRAELAAIRDAIPDSQREEAAARVAERLADACEGKGIVMVFLSFRSELPTLSILERLGEKGHELAVPHLEGTEIRSVAYEPGEPLGAARWGIPEPADLRPIDAKTIDAIAAPGLGFDRRGYRLGYGGGYYDRMFTRTRPDCLRAGIGFHVQVVEAIPHGSRDQRLDLVLTERETISCNR